MKFLRVAGVHYSFAKRVPYQQNPSLQSRSYQEQLQTIFSYFFNYGDSLTHALHKHGYETAEVLHDVEPLQTQWALENGCTGVSEIEILIAQIQKFKPDVLYLHNTYSPLISEIIHQRKQLFPF